MEYFIVHDVHEAWWIHERNSHDLLTMAMGLSTNFCFVPFVAEQEEIIHVRPDHLLLDIAPNLGPLVEKLTSSKIADTKVSGF